MAVCYSWRWIGLFIQQNLVIIPCTMRRVKESLGLRQRECDPVLRCLRVYMNTDEESEHRAPTQWRQWSSSDFQWKGKMKARRGEVQAPYCRETAKLQPVQRMFMRRSCRATDLPVSQRVTSLWFLGFRAQHIATGLRIYRESTSFSVCCTQLYIRAVLDY